MHDYESLCMTMPDYVGLCMPKYDYVGLCMRGREKEKEREGQYAVDLDHGDVKLSIHILSLKDMINWKYHIP